MIYKFTLNENNQKKEQAIMSTKKREFKQEINRKRDFRSPQMNRRHFLGVSGAATAAILMGPAFLTRAVASPGKAMKGKEPARISAVF